jgi:hypothetical protein
MATRAPSFLLCFRLLGRRLDLGQQPVEVGPAVEPPVGDDGADVLRVRDVLQRVRLQQYEVGQLAFFYGAEFVGALEEAGGMERGGS